GANLQRRRRYHGKAKSLPDAPPPKKVLDSPLDLCPVDVADDRQNRITRNIVPAIEVQHVRSTKVLYRLRIPDRRAVLWMSLEHNLVQNVGRLHPRHIEPALYLAHP